MTGPLPSLQRDSHRGAKVRLHQLIRELAGAGAVRLPAEDQLSLQLGVSRPTVRSALLSLQKEGLLDRSHGRGTFIRRHAVAIESNLAEDRRFVELIQERGHEPDATVVGRTVGRLPEDIAGKLGRPAGDEVLVLERLITASGEPAVYAVDHVPLELVPDVEAPGEPSVFDFLERHAGRAVRYSVADIVPAVADDEVACRLALDVGGPLLLLLHTHIDAGDEPVAVTRAYVSPRFLSFSVVRTYRDV